MATEGKLALLLIAGIAGLGGLMRAYGAEPDGGMPAIASIKIPVNPPLSEKEMMDTLPVKVGDPYDPKQNKAVNEAVLSLYRSQGFMKARVDSRVEIKGSSATLVIGVEEGPVFRFGETKIDGLVTLPDKV